ncbi:MAG: hypothetical protein WA417_18660 [Stellaceae bacterium]
MMTPLLPDEFEVDTLERRVLHKESGIWFRFYEYLNEEDWKRSDSVIYRDNPNWPGDRNQLAAAAKNAALVKGMKARKPTHH